MIANQRVAIPVLVLQYPLSSTYILVICKIIRANLDIACERFL